MRDKPPPDSPSSEAPGENGGHGPENADAARVEELARLDDLLGGVRGTPLAGGNFDQDPGSRKSPDATGSSSSNLSPKTLDAMLLLRQVAAMERGSGTDQTDDESTAGALPDIPPYEIVGVLGRGGFSIVYDAFDTRISRRLALKVIRPEVMMMPGMRRRFLREAEIAARLRHPNIIVILDVGSTDGRVYLAEEFCEGGSLADWLDHHASPVPAREAAAFVALIADAIAAAHGKAALHRDLKPANILLVPQGRRQATLSETPDSPSVDSLSAWQPKVADFGLATLQTDDSGARLTRLTAAGSRLGTPAWMAPEQIDASFGAVGVRTDVYAIGRILERLLTGQSSYRGESEAESFRRILLAPPIPVDRIVPETPADLAAVCLKCLERQPADRYESADALADDLGRYLAGKPTKARPRSRVSRLVGAALASPWTGPLATLLVLAAFLLIYAGRQQLMQQLQLDRQAAVTRRIDAAAGLLRGFNELRSGDVAMALDSVQRSLETEPDLADSLAVSWLETRIHGEEEILFEMPGGSPAYALAISEDHSQVIAGAQDGTLAVIRLDAAEGARGPAATLNVEDEINAVAVTPDGNRVVVVTQTGRLSVYRTSTLEELHRSDWGAALYGLACSPDGKHIAFGGEDRVLHVVDGDDPARLIHAIDLKPLPFHEKVDPEIEAICFLDPSHVAATLGNRLLRIDILGRKVVASIDAGHENIVHENMAWSPAAQLICVSGGSVATPVLFSADRLELVGALPTHPRWIRGCSFTPDGSKIATACRDGILRVFDTQSRQELHRLVGHVGQVWKTLFADGETLVSAGDDGTIRRWSVPSSPLPKEKLARMTFTPLPRDQRSTEDSLWITTSSICRLPGGATHFATLDSRGFLRLFHPRTTTWGPPSKLALDPPFPPAYTGKITCSFTGEWLAVSSPTGQSLRVHLDAAGGHVSWPIVAGINTRTSKMCWTNDERLVVTEPTTGRLFLLDRDGTNPLELDKSLHQLGYQALTASKQMPTRLIAADHDRVVLFTLDSDGKRIVPDRELPLSIGEIVVMGWSADGSRVACGTTDGSVFLYDFTSGDIPAPQVVASHSRKVVAVAFDARGQTLLSADSETVRIHDVVSRVTYDELSPGFRIMNLDVLPEDAAIVLTSPDGLWTLPLRHE